ncbi:MAG: hypothetical protein PHS32_10300 [Rhodoferax sp.]|uniref:hypothetical protein n=1 Tax=Rhodoferax sp. TaxID=50421 RepID=UPI00262DE891|nr:hypothetical protein [Rhodoferax sp.]MDD5334127.1 hypothetical protein [Rhodoferax sp.]
MKTSLSFRRQPDLTRMIMAATLLILAVFWLVLLVNSAMPGRAAGVKVWIVVAGLCLLVQGRRQSLAIASGARVLGQLRTPEHLWRAWLRGSLAEAMRVWGLLVLGAVALLLLSESPWQWSSAVAMFSAILSLSTLAALSNHGLLHRAWAWAIVAGGVLLTLFATLTIGLVNIPNQLGQTSFVLQGLLALSWPLLAYWLMTIWQRQAPMAPAGTGQSAKGFWSRSSAYARRYTRLNPVARNRTSDNLVQTSPFWTLFKEFSSLFWIAPVAIQGLAVPWHGNIGPYHLLGFGLVALLTVPSVVCKDLHWRQLLAPGGLHRGQLGWPILRTTLTFQMLALLLLASLWTMVNWAAFDVPVSRTLETAWKYRVFPLEWFFATSLAVVLRAMGAASVRAFVVLLSSLTVTLLLLGGAMLWAFGQSRGPTLFSVGPSYVSGLLIATFGLAVLSNRLWTVKKLLPSLRLR